jgi:hypothetical protein
VTGLAVFRILAPLVAWGVVIDTIEIQDVRVLSAEVFERMRLESEIERATRVATHKALEQQAQLAMEREKAEASVETARTVRPTDLTELVGAVKAVVGR